MLDTLRIESSGVPIYVQIREQMLGVIGAGVLKPGDQMPTMRQVAVALRIDLNTVRHGYDELEQAGAITAVRGVGTFVADHPPKLEAGIQAERIDKLARQSLAMAMSQGVDPSEVARRLLEMAAQKAAQKAGGQ
jgi:GntR family transcriptional regulator